MTFQSDNGTALVGELTKELMRTLTGRSSSLHDIPPSDERLSGKTE